MGEIQCQINGTSPLLAIVETADNYITDIGRQKVWQNCNAPNVERSASVN